MSQQPYEQQWGRPQDAVPGRQPSSYPLHPYTPIAPQVVVNVVQQNNAPVYVRRRGLNNKLHFWLTFWTGGAWGLFVWLPLAVSRRRR